MLIIDSKKNPKNKIHEQVKIHFSKVNSVMLRFFGYTSIYQYIYSFCVLESTSVAFCHVKFHKKYTIHYASYFEYYGLQVSLSNFLNFGLFVETTGSYYLMIAEDI